MSLEQDSTVAAEASPRLTAGLVLDLAERLVALFAGSGLQAARAVFADRGNVAARVTSDTLARFVAGFKKARERGTAKR